MSPKYVLFRWPDRDYRGALEDYFTAQNFVLGTGLLNHGNVGGYIKAPRHPDYPERGTVPADLLDDPRWHSAVVAYSDDEETLSRLESLPLPEGCTRSTGDAKP